MPSLPDLLRLDLSNNALLGKDLNILANNYPKLETLKLSNNLIKADWESLKAPFSKMSESLISLDLSANPISDPTNNYYRD